MMAREKCDGTCACACDYSQQDHPYSQWCIPSCMLAERQLDARGSE